MKYGTAIIVLALINIITVYSGLPTGAKKGVIVVTTLALLCIGWIIRKVAQKRAKRLEAQKNEVEKMIAPEMEQVANEIAEDVADQVEHELGAIEHSGDARGSLKEKL